MVAGPSALRLSAISFVEDCGKMKLDRAAAALSRRTKQRRRVVEAHP